MKLSYSFHISRCKLNKPIKVIHFFIRKHWNKLLENKRCTLCIIYCSVVMVE